MSTLFRGTSILAPLTRLARPSHKLALPSRSALAALSRPGQLGSRISVPPLSRAVATFPRVTPLSTMSNIVNFYSGDPPLNRVSFQRPHADKMNAHLHDPNAKFVVYNKGMPLVKKGEVGHTIFLPYSAVSHVLGGDFQTAPEGTNARDAKAYDSARLPHDAPTVVFLGIDERGFEKPAAQKTAVDYEDPKGAPYFAVDVTHVADKFDEAAVGGEWGEARANGSLMSHFDAGIFALSRHLIDWNWRNKFCAGCGSRTYSLWAGWKRNCITSVEPKEGVEPCFSTQGLHNFAYPRTDPVIIMGILDASGERMLLGRQKSWPKGMYSCLAGFIEPGESFEEAVRREVLEEAGVVVGPVSYSSSQPWPYPANLMVGCYGRAEDGQKIRLDLDNELEDAQWFPKELVAKVVADPGGSTYTREDLQKLDAQSYGTHGQHGPLDDIVQRRMAEQESFVAFTRVPPETAIAGQLVRHWISQSDKLELVSRL